MPTYPGVSGSFVPASSNISPISLEKGQSVYVLGQLASTATQLPVQDGNVTFEAAPAGATVASIAVYLPTMEASPNPVISVEARMNGAPGGSESIQTQEADTDADGFYASYGTAMSTFTGNFQRTDFSGSGSPGKFIRVLRTKGANAVGCTVKITRIA